MSHGSRTVFELDKILLPELLVDSHIIHVKIVQVRRSLVALVPRVFLVGQNIHNFGTDQPRLCLY